MLPIVSTLAMLHDTVHSVIPVIPVMIIMKWNGVEARGRQNRVVST